LNDLLARIHRPSNQNSECIKAILFKVTDTRVGVIAIYIRTNTIQASGTAPYLPSRIFTSGFQTPFCNRIELPFHISFFAQNDSSSDSTLGKDSFSRNTETYGMEFEHEIGFYCAKKSVYILILDEKIRDFRTKTTKTRQEALCFF